MTVFLASVVRNTWLTPTVFELSFQTEPLFSFRPGQFISVMIPGAGPQGRDLRRAYSIASPPEGSLLQLWVKYLPQGPGSTYLQSLTPGQTFRMMAPYGDFTPQISSPPRFWCFVSTGTGLAPFRSVLLSQAFEKAPPLHTWCLFGTRHDSELLFPPELVALPSEKWTWLPTLSQASSEWAGARGRVTDLLKGPLAKTLPWLETDFYLCGHGGMIQEVKALLLEKGVPKTALHQEAYYR